MMHSKATGPATDPRDEDGIFEEARPRLLGLAYRILGSRADAEDAVQDSYVKWRLADRSAIQNPASWLTTICTRRCLDLLRSAHRSRVDYVGAWLPEPIHTPIDNEADARLDLAGSLATAFLLMLERLTPKERAAYLLHEIFDVSYPEIAETLGIQEAAGRKLVSRAKASIDQAKVRHATPVDRQEELLAAFQAAITEGVPGKLAMLLSDDIRLSADGGGKVPTVSGTLIGRAAVVAFATERLHDFWAAYDWTIADINGGRGIVLRLGGATAATVSFAYDEEGKATDIFIMRNPDKLSRLDAVSIH
ncbi:RNA polymerase sigma factor SigJ [Mesorhizobium sp. L-8-10]|uniref:RNA polymerase sigma factor SigJ n=1 Tax=Mesorhizobium sp. L-8-10 TaxID=2744523 RepID=UPI00193621FA|nr:RNA polymerase sigma factor SigJ [Mesorhizobium sp. L-8-10]BCH31994.1 RNA polymerase sigma factor SigJ [Mesorhizobium sp. L-8-10]